MTTTLTRKGQVTIPKRIRDALDLKPGSKVDFQLNGDGAVVIQGASRPASSRHDRFDEARGRADIPWRTDALMALLRGDD